MAGSVLASAALSVDPAVLGRRIAEARAALEHCMLCEWRCGANRLAGESAPCHLGAETYAFRRCLSLTEEPELIPTLRVHLSGCNFRCRFCNMGPTCFDPAAGEAVAPARLAAELAEAVARGVRTIDLLGGEPSLHVHTLLELAAAAPEPLPLVLDTNLYMTPEVLDWLDGVVAWYVADFKFGNNDCASRLAGVERYWEVLTRNLARVWGRTPLIVRHLLMPGHLACCYLPVVDWLAAHLPGVRFQLNTSYLPCWRAQNDPALARLNRRDEVAAAQEYLAGTPLDWRVDGGA